MARLQLTIAADGLRAELRVGPGPPMTLAELEAAIRAAGIVHGIDRDAVAESAVRLASADELFLRVIATGERAVAGVDGRIDSPLFGPQLPGRVAVDGTIDFRERLLLHPVQQGQVIAEVVPPTAGTPGQDVRGRQLPAKPGKPHTMRLGGGVRLDGTDIVASLDGVLLATDRVVDAVPLFTHEGDVAYASGNLHTRGSLAVRGDVQPGFTVEAEGDIAITGTVQESTVVAGGSVRVEQGILGRTTRVRAGGDVNCRHATAAAVLAPGGIIAMEQCSQARLSAGRIRIVDGRGTALGGELRARTEIDVGTAGAPGGGTTLLAVGELLDEEAELARRTLEAARTDRSALRARRDDAPGARSHMKGLRSAVRAMDRKAEEALRLRRRQQELLTDAVIRVRHVLHPGVVLRFAGLELRPDTAQPPAEYRFDPNRNQIVQGPIR